MGEWGDLAVDTDVGFLGSGTWDQWMGRGESSAVVDWDRVPSYTLLVLDHKKVVVPLAAPSVESCRGSCRGSRPRTLSTGTPVDRGRARAGTWFRDELRKESVDLVWTLFDRVGFRERNIEHCIETSHLHTASAKPPTHSRSCSFLPASRNTSIEQRACVPHFPPLLSLFISWILFSSQS